VRDTSRKLPAVEVSASKDTSVGTNKHEVVPFATGTPGSERF